MIYEFQISFVTKNDKGKDVTKKEQYLVEHRDTFQEVELEAFEKFKGYEDLDVIAIKRSNIVEIINGRSNDNEKIFFATLTDIFHNDDGSEKEIRYIIALFAQDIRNAHKIVEEYTKQGYDMQIKQIKETKLIDLII